MKNGPRMETS
jgi:hypothetical protein